MTLPTSTFTPLAWKTEWTRWQPIQQEKGVIVAVSKEQQWLLPWWWNHYSACNSYPVIFVDFGMSEQANTWCEKRGTLLSLPKWPKGLVARKSQIDLELLKKWKKHFTKNFLLSSRKYWFQKPFAMCKTPFRKTIWLDLDCQVQSSLEPLFGLLTKSKEFGCIREPIHTQIKRLNSGLLQPGEILYNSGVIVYRHGADLMTKWSKASVKSNHLFWGDQEVLSNVIFQTKESIIELPRMYNWFYYWEGIIDAKIVHYVTSKGKRFIKEQINRFSQLPFMKFDWTIYP